MDFYQINDLERLSGIKAHTIRIWEKRYAIIKPYRTETNIRYYDDDQLKKLLNVASLATIGFKISKIAAFSEAELKEQIIISQNNATNANPYTFYLNDFVAAMLDFNEIKFNNIFEEVVGKFGVETAIVEIIYPFLHKTGLLWSLSETMPVQEHFASTLIKRKLFGLINELPYPSKKTKKFLLFLPANEWHELGLLFAEYLIKVRGFETLSLGQNVPSADIEYVIKKAKPDFLLTFLVSESAEHQIAQLSNFLAHKFKKITFLLSGNSTRIEQLESHPSIKVLRNPKDILKFLQ